MTNIFARKPGTNLPAKRYELFISAFEKQVSEIQKRVSRMQRMERVYNVVRDVMEKAQLPHESSIKLDEDRITVHIVANETDKMETFEQLRSKFGQAFVEAKLRDDPVGPSRIGGYSPTLHYQWHMLRAAGEESRGVFLDIKLPRNGLADYEVVERREEYMTYSTTFEVIKRPHIIDGVVE